MAPELAQFLERIPEERQDGFVFSPTMPGQKTARPRLDTVSKLVTSIGKAAGVKVGEAKKVVGREERTVIRYAGAHDFRRAFGLRWAARIMPKDLMS